MTSWRWQRASRISVTQTGRKFLPDHSLRDYTATQVVSLLTFGQNSPTKAEGASDSLKSPSMSLPVSHLLLRTTEWLGLEGTYGSIFSNPCLSRATQSRCPGPHLKISTTIFLSNLCQHSIVCTVQKRFLMFRWNLSYSSLYPIPLVLALGTAENSMAPSSLQPPFIDKIHSLSLPFSRLSNPRA